MEVVCEFRFAEGSDWDLTMPGRLYERLREDFPETQSHSSLHFKVDADEQRVAQVSEERARFVRRDGTALVQVAQHLLAVNHLRPYPGWADYRRLVGDTLSVYRKVAAPDALERLGLRYINRIAVPFDEQDFTLNDYIKAVPQVPEAIPRRLYRHFMRLEVAFDTPPGILLLQSGSMPPDEDGQIPLVLDIEFATKEGEAPALDACAEWLDGAHEQVSRAFEACLGEKSRPLFEEGAADG